MYLLIVAVLLLTVVGIALRIDAENRIENIYLDEDEQDAQDIMDLLFLDEEEEIL